MTIGLATKGMIFQREDTSPVTIATAVWNMDLTSFNTAKTAGKIQKQTKQIAEAILATEQ